MSRGARITAVAVAAFAAIVIARFPARWAASALPRGTTCARVMGSLWSGSCAGLAERGSPIGDLTWNAHPLALLTLSLSADVELSRGSATARGRVDVGPSGRVTARAVRADFPLDHAVLPELPPGMQGSAHADIPLLRWNGRVTALRGRLDVHGLTDGRGEPIGDYRLVFPADSSSAAAASGALVGRLTDLGGPLSVEGTVRLTPEPGYVVDAKVAPRPGAPPDLVNAIRFLGTPDSSGHWPLSIAGTF